MTASLKSEYLAESNTTSRRALAIAQEAYNRAAGKFATDTMRWQSARQELLKQAGFGQSQNSQFEQAFGSIAFTYLQDKAPGLLDHVVGFQLLDRQEDGKKAVGAFVAQIGDKIIDIPMFFVNGELKGHQVMRLRNPELFIPLREAFLDYLFSKLPGDLGEVGPNLRVPDVTRSTPSMQPFDGSRYVKSGAEDHLHSWAVDKHLAQAYAEMLYNPTNLELGLDLLDKKTAKLFDLPELLCRSENVIKTAAQLSDAYPVFASFLNKHLGADWLIKAAKDLKASLQKESKALQVRPSRIQLPGGNYKKTSNLRFITSVDVLPTQLEVKGLRDKASEEILRYGEYIEDSRDKTAELWRIDDDPSGEFVKEDRDVHIVAADEPDFYQVATVDGKKRQAVIWPSMNRNPSSNYDLIIDPNSKKWIEAERSTYIAYRGTNMELSPESLSGGFIKPNRRRPSEGDIFFVMPGNGKRTIAGPFLVREKLSANSFKVEDLTGDLHHTDHHKEFDRVVPIRYGNTEEVIFTGSDKNTLQTGTDSSTIVFPKSQRVYVIGSSKDSHYLSFDKRQSLKLNLLSRGTIRLDELGKHANLNVQVKSAGEVVINDVPMREREARRWLVSSVGLSKAAAQQVLAGPSIKTRYVVCPADRSLSNLSDLSKLSYYVPDLPFPPYGDNATTSESGNYLTETPEQLIEQADFEQTAGPLMPWEDPPHGGNPGFGSGPSLDGDIQNLMQGNNGDIMADMVGLVAILNNSRVDSHIRKASKALLSAVDKLGRLIFVFHSHRDEFSEQFGEEELEDLEAAMTSVFETAGDLFIDLSRNSGSMNPELDITDVPTAMN